MSDEALFTITWSDGTEMSKPTYIHYSDAKWLLDKFRVKYVNVPYHSYSYSTFKVDLRDHGYNDEFSENLLRVIDEESSRAHLSRI